MKTLRSIQLNVSILSSRPMVILREESYLTEAIRPLIQNLADLQDLA